MFNDREEEIVVQIKSSLGPFYRDVLFSRPMNMLYKETLNNSPHSFWEGISLAPAIGRFLLNYYIPRKIRSQGRTFNIDSSDRITQDPNLQGAPIGGIGSGFITRSFLGSFTRYHIKTGDVKNVDIPINQFSLAVHRPTYPKKSKRQAMVLNPSRLINRSKVGKKWKWWDLNAEHRLKNHTPSFFRNMIGTFHCRFPFSFYEYEKPETFRIVQKQYSPIIPGDYESSSLPIGIFRHGIENLSDEPLTFSIMFTFQNGTGENCKAGGHYCRAKKSKIKILSFVDDAKQKEEECDDDDNKEENEGETSDDEKEKEEEEEIKKEEMVVEEEEEEEEAVWVEMYNRYTHQNNTGLLSVEKFNDPLVFSIGAIPDRVGKESDDDDDEYIKEKEEEEEGELKLQKEDSIKKKDFEITVCESFRSSSKNHMNNLWDMFEEEGKIGDVGEYIEMKRQLKKNRKTKKKKSGSFLSGISKVGEDEANDAINEFMKKQEEEEKEEEKKEEEPAYISKSGETIASAICVKVTVEPKQQRSFTMILGIHHPIARFQENAFTKQYTKHFRENEEVCIIEQLMKKSFRSFRIWDEKISAFQEPILENSEIPADYKLALFNELYFLCAGGTVWTSHRLQVEVDEQDNPRYVEIPEEHFGLLEGQEYHMYNTYDVYVYASFALLALFPEIQKSIQMDFAHFIMIEDDRHTNFGSGSGKRKEMGAVPHDLGSPHEAPFQKINSYIFQNTNKWKDLGSHYVCSLYRDYVHTKDQKLLETCFPAARMVIEYYYKNFVNKKTGLIENEGFPDQTYDQWSMAGVTSYCGVLWLSALASFLALCRAIGKQEKEMEKYNKILTHAMDVFEKQMWVKEKTYYRHSYATEKKKSDSIMLDGLFGHLFLRSSELPPVLKPSRISKALRTMYLYNVKNGKGVNGMLPTGKGDESNQQAKEVWTGTNYAFAAILMYEGYRTMAFSTVRQVHLSCWLKFGFIFQTPEAYFPETGTYRSLAYCRPMSIWAVQMAYDWSKKKEEKIWKENLAQRLKFAEEERKRFEEKKKKKEKKEEEEDGEEES